MASKNEQGFKAWKDIERSASERRRESHSRESSAAFRRVSPWIV